MRRDGRAGHQTLRVPRSTRGNDVEVRGVGPLARPSVVQTLGGAVSTPGVGAIEGVAAAVAPDVPAQSGVLPGRGDRRAMRVGSVAVGHSWVEPETGRGRDGVVFVPVGGHWGAV